MTHLDDQHIRDRIRAAGLRVTAGRVAVYSHLLEASGPLRHGDLVGALEHLRLDQATVYRNLIDLTNAGLVQRTDIGDHTWRFEAVENVGKGHGAGHHPHFICTVCGDVQCLDGVEVRFVRAAGTLGPLTGDAPTTAAGTDAVAPHPAPTPRPDAGEPTGAVHALGKRPVEIQLRGTCDNCA